jgi:hypothetical protein
MSDHRIDPLLRRWVFPMVKTGQRFVIPYGDLARRALVESGEYDPSFPPFLERVLAALADPAFVPGSYYPGGWYRALLARGEDPGRAEPDPEALRPFYREELRVDRQGRWWCGARPIKGRVLRFFLRHLRHDAELGLYCVRYPLGAGEEAQYLRTESPPLRVKRLEPSHDPPCLLLNDGTAEPLRGKTLWLDDEDRLYCAVKPQNLTAVIDDPARWEILSTLEEADGRWFIQVSGRRLAVPVRKQGAS